MKRALHILLLLLCVSALSCRGPRMIPRDKLEDIYYEMFVTDQMLRDDPTLRRRADSTLVYEAVFNRYGYDTDDYLYTLQESLKDPERFAKVLEKVGDRLRADANSVEKIVNYQAWVAGFMGQKRPPVDSILAAFSQDSLFIGLARVERNDAPYGGWFRLRAVREDSLMMAGADSLAALADSLSVVKDTVVAVKEIPVPEEVAEEVAP